MKIKKLLDNNIAKTILINIVYMLWAFICFEPFATYDDYNMAIQYASGVGSKYALGQTFVTPIFGKLIFDLNNLVPSIPWYFVVNTIIIFVSLSIITYQIYKLNWGICGKIIINIILLFYSYEEYTGMNFTKVAGVAAVAGVFLLIMNYKSISTKLVAYILIGFSILLRYNLIILAVGVLGLYVVVQFVYKLLTKIEIKRSLKEFTYTIVALLLCVPLLYMILNEKIIFTSEQYDEFANQVEVNSARSGVQDYEIPNYDVYSEEYNNINYSKNDLNILYKWNFDREKLTTEKYDIISQMNKDEIDSRNNSVIRRAFSLKNIVGFFKEYPYLFFQMDVWYALVIVLMICCIYLKPSKKYLVYGYSILTLLLNLGMMYYLFIGGRYNQHRVDIAIELALILGFIFLCKDFEYSSQTFTGKIIVTMTLLLFVPYRVHDDYYWGVINNSVVSDIKDFFNDITEDKSHFYLLSYTRGDIDIFRMYSLTDITKDNYENKYTNISQISNFFENKYLQEYNIEDLYYEAVNSNTIRFVMSHWDTGIDDWQLYFSDRYGDNVYLEKIKECDSKNIYILRSENQNLVNYLDVLHNGNIAMNDITYNIFENTIYISGNINLDGSDALNQTLYLVVFDSKSERKAEYTLCQYKNSETGNYTLVNQKIDVPDFYTNDDKIKLFIEKDGMYYEIILK